MVHPTLLELEGLKTLDLFGGTGCISYELASRGAVECHVVEKDPVMHAFIKKTGASLGMEQLHLYQLDVFRYIESTNEQFDFIFAGPPYALTSIDELPRKIFQHGLLKKAGWFVLEHTPRNNYQSFPHYRTERNYGTTIFSIFIQD